MGPTVMAVGWAFVCFVGVAFTERLALGGIVGQVVDRFQGFN